LASCAIAEADRAVRVTRARLRVVDFMGALLVR
jgi:hypothetical protein